MKKSPISKNQSKQVSLKNVKFQAVIQEKDSTLDSDDFEMVARHYCPKTTDLSICPFDTFFTTTKMNPHEVLHLKFMKSVYYRKLFVLILRVFDMLENENGIVELIKLVDMKYLDFKREEYEAYNPEEEADKDDIRTNRKKTNKQKASL